ncbi:MAG: hydantoinase/oxoprolinase family protein [Rhodospirillaceae bacterium]|jgi:N-methylhydantoinase A
MANTGESGFEIGIDTGGTFTDVVCYHEGQPIRTTKIPSTPDDPSIAILEAITHAERAWNVAPETIRNFAHGTTVATNAVIERKGGSIGLLTTAGFSDVLEIGRQMRHQLYEIALRPETPVFLAPGHRRKGVVERIASDGSVIQPLDEASVIESARALVESGADAIAIVFLFSFLNPSHEQRAKELIEAEFPGLKVSISYEVDPTFREYERTVVTAFDAYVKPVVDSYLERLKSELSKAGVPNEPMIMQSRGGLSGVSIARQRPVRLFLSGPAAGVVGAAAVGEALGERNLISVDIGGTSTDIALIQDARPKLHTESKIEGYPVRVNMVDVNAIGAGGGSLVWFDPAGGLRVGPGSAGARPGPACYGLGGEQATVTDASVVLGYLNPDFFAGGTVALDVKRARQVIEETVAGRLGLSVLEAAQGIHRIVNAQMAEGIRLVSIRRGYDPREFALVALGGAGPVHGTALADELAIRKVIIPRHPGVLSAMGLLMASIEHEAAASVQKDLHGLAIAEVKAVLDELDGQCRKPLEADGADPASAQVRHLADVCYVGQSHYLEVPFDVDGSQPLANLFERFKQEHDRVYGHATDAPARIVNLRSVHSVTRRRQIDTSTAPTAAAKSLKGTREVMLLDAQATQPVDVHDRDATVAGQVIDGPAIIEQTDTTTVVGRHWRATVKNSLDLVLEKLAVS